MIATEYSLLIEEYSIPYYGAINKLNQNFIMDKFQSRFMPPSQAIVRNSSIINGIGLHFVNIWIASVIEPLCRDKRIGKGAQAQALPGSNDLMEAYPLHILGWVPAAVWLSLPLFDFWVVLHIRCLALPTPDSNPPAAQSLIPRRIIGIGRNSLLNQHFQDKSNNILGS